MVRGFRKPMPRCLDSLITPTVPNLRHQVLPIRCNFFHPGRLCMVPVCWGVVYLLLKSGRLLTNALRYLAAAEPCRRMCGTCEVKAPQAAQLGGPNKITPK